MDGAAAINFARVGAQQLWAGTVHIHADAKTSVLYHGVLESVSYVMEGNAGSNDFIFAPPYVSRQEINVSADNVLNCVLVRSDQDLFIMNLDVEPVETPLSVI